MPAIETLINTSLSLSHINTQLIRLWAQPNAQLHTKIFLQGGQTKTETKQQRDKTLPKRQERAKETKSQKERERERAKESPEKSS